VSRRNMRMSNLLAETGRWKEGHRAMARRRVASKARRSAARFDANRVDDSLDFRGRRRGGPLKPHHLEDDPGAVDVEDVTCWRSPGSMSLVAPSGSSQIRKPAPVGATCSRWSSPAPSS
jgi:hypothetical protein